MCCRSKKYSSMSLAFQCSSAFGSRNPSSRLAAQRKASLSSSKWLHPYLLPCLFEQGSLHYTPEHCLVHGGFSSFWWKKNMLQMGKMHLLRSSLRTFRLAWSRHHVSVAALARSRPPPLSAAASRGRGSSLGQKIG